MEIFNLCSNPFEGEFQNLAAQLSTSSFLALIGRTQKLDELQQRPEDPYLFQIRATVKSLPATMGYWIPEISTTFHALQSPEDEAGLDWIHAQLTVGGFLAGVLEAFSLELNEPVLPIYAAGRTISAPCLKVEGAEDRLQIKDGNGTSLLEVVSFGKINNRYLWGEVKSSPFVTLAGNPAIKLVNLDWDRQWGPVNKGGVERDQAALDQFNAAFEFLREHLPEYYAWVSLVTSDLTPICRPGINTIGSSSSDRRWGGLNIASPAMVSETVEMLIHEASHQYFYLLNGFGAIVSPDADEYYSPLKKCKRPLDRILLGYHAFANASLAFESLVKQGFAELIRERKECVDHYMRELLIPLESEAGLAPMGLALYRPLRKRVDHLFYSLPASSVEK